MARGPDEDPDLELVSEYLAKRGLRAVHFTKEERRAGKTPDFRVMRGGELVAYCEVKSPRDDWLDEQLDRAESFQLVGGARNDPTFNRIAALVHKAVGQLDAVNPDRSKPNILALVNHDRQSRFRDLEETLTGMLRLADGSKAPINLRVSEGRIRLSKFRIDAYLWFDAKVGGLKGHMLNRDGGARLDEVCVILGIDRGTIER